MHPRRNYRYRNDPDQAAHGKFGKIYGHIHDRNKDIARAFDELSRSEALFKLAIMNRLGLITKEEMARFSKETQDFIAAWDR